MLTEFLPKSDFLKNIIKMYTPKYFLVSQCMISYFFYRPTPLKT